MSNAKERTEIREKARRLYEKGMPISAIARITGKSVSGISGWKKKEGWEVKKDKIIRQYTEQEALELNSLRESNLNEQQRMFCAAYVRTRNATQSYAKAYNVDPADTNTVTHAYHLLHNKRIKKQISELMDIKLEAIVATQEDVVKNLIEYHMRIAFSDLGDYIKFGSREEEIVDIDTGKTKKEIVNYTKLVDSNRVDTQLIKKIVQTREGVSIELMDKKASLEWLDKFFVVHPMDRHKIEYENRKLALLERNTAAVESIADDGFLEALKGASTEDWNDTDE